MVRCPANGEHEARDVSREEGLDEWGMTVASTRDDLMRMVGDLIGAYANVDHSLLRAQGFLQEGMSANANLEITAARDELVVIRQHFVALLEYVDLNIPPEQKPFDA